jgi:hypothetical protein
MLLLVQYLSVLAALSEKPTVGRVRRSAAAKPGAETMVPGVVPSLGPILAIFQEGTMHDLAGG